jgi:hypothetical protein
LGSGLVGRPMTSKHSGIEPKALDLVEEAMHLLRRKNSYALAEYYLGSLPFILSLLYFWSDMSRNPMAAWYCGPSSAGVALTFIWMKLWHARFCRNLWCRLQDTVPAPWSWKRMLSTAARQSFLHSLGIFVLPLAAVVVVPFGWVYAFFQNLSTLDEIYGKDVSGLARAAKDQAALWPGQNHLILTIMSLFGSFVFLNLALGIVAVPYLLKWILGIETVFTLSGIRLLNTTFIAVLCGLTYLCIDPIIKTVYVLRCFYGRSRLTGDDLRSALRPLMMLGLFVIIFAVCSPARAWVRETGAMPLQETTRADQDYARRLDSAIQSVLQERRFAWRLPRQQVPDSDARKGWIASTINRIADGVKNLLRPVGRWIKAFIRWLKQKQPGPSIPRAQDGRDYRGLIRWIFYALGFGMALWLIYWLVRWLIRSRPVPREETSTSESDFVDLSDESITADDLPLDQWIATARDMIARSDFRSALRALYLSVLALLAERQRVTIASYKSNLDYTRELGRRSHDTPELLVAFDWCVKIFERAWYGMYPVSRSQVDNFFKQQQRIADLVQRTD